MKLFYFLLGLVLMPLFSSAQRTYIVCPYDSPHIAPSCFKGKPVVEGDVNFHVPGRYFIKMWCIDKGDTLSRDSAYIEVVPLPKVNAYTLPDLCDNDPPFSLASYGNPRQGQWYCKTKPFGIINNTLYPNALQAGSHWLSYRYTDPKTGCYDTDSAEITIKACATGLVETPGQNLPEIFPVPAHDYLKVPGVTDRSEITLITALGKRKRQ